MDEKPRIGVSVVYAEPHRVFSVEMTLPCGATVADAIDGSGVRAARPDIAIHADRVGIFARKVSLDTVLRDGDRVEIYRPLAIDPKEARRNRARMRSAKST
jgi:putative ubiquitin-RnfH superfamily antitoxin RatB of RatAB toxin-antitoxin module